MMVNAMFDGMNLVAKEGPLVNERDGVSILSENTGAHEELGEFSLSVNPFDVQELADSIYAALTMAPEERARRASGLKEIVTLARSGRLDRRADRRHPQEGARRAGAGVAHGRGRLAGWASGGAQRSNPNSSSTAPGAGGGAGTTTAGGGGAGARRGRPLTRAPRGDAPRRRRAAACPRGAPRARAATHGARLFSALRLRATVALGLPRAAARGLAGRRTLRGSPPSRGGAAVARRVPSGASGARRRDLRGRAGRRAPPARPAAAAAAPPRAAATRRRARATASTAATRRRSPSARADAACPA